MLMLRHQQVLNNRHLTEQANVLKSAHHAHPGDLLAGQAFQMLLAQLNGAAGRLVEAGQAVENGGLARAVRADQRDDLLRAQLQRHVIDRQQAAEAHHQTLNG